MEIRKWIKEQESTQDTAQVKAYAQKKKLKIIKTIARGWSSWIYLAKNKKGKKFALKIEREDSPRTNMCEKEVENLKLSNSIGIGPKLMDWNLKNGIIVMEFVNGITLDQWILEQKHSKKEIESVIGQLMEQGRKLDELGLDHGQLAGRGRNILVRKKGKKWCPVIIDFEKASTQRRVHNVTQLESFLLKNPYGVIARKIRKKLSENFISKITP